MGESRLENAGEEMGQTEYNKQNLISGLVSRLPVAAGPEEAKNF